MVMVVEVRAVYMFTVHPKADSVACVRIGVKVFGTLTPHFRIANAWAPVKVLTYGVACDGI